MSADSQWPVQKAVYTRLVGDAALQTLLGNPPRVFDHVPAGSAFPYVVIGESRGAPFDGKTEDGFEQTVTLHTWSRYRGLKETKDIMAGIVAALDGADPLIAGHHLVLLRLVFAATMVDPDGLTRHGIQRFRIVTQRQ